MPDWFTIFPDWVNHIIFALSRWLHIVGTALIVGGTLFFEFVVPRAMDEMRMEDQMSLVARLRLAFRQIIWISAVMLPVTGLFNMYHQWPAYLKPDKTGWSAAFPWAMSHMVGGCIIVFIAVAIVAGRRVPDRARGWLKVNFVIMLTVVFLANAASHVREYTRERQAKMGTAQPQTLPPLKR